MRVRRLLVGFVTVLAATAVLGGGSGGATPTSPAPVIGIGWSSPSATLAWFDPVTLRPLPGRKVGLADYGWPWTFSKDRSVLVLGSGNKASLRFVDARSMRALGDLALMSRLSPARSIDTIAWLTPNRLVAVVPDVEGAIAVVVDPVRRQVVRRVRLPRAAWASAKVPGGLVVLLGSWKRIAPAQVATISPEGAIRLVQVERIQIGFAGDPAHLGRIAGPGFAVDPSRSTAYLVGPGSLVAEINVESLGVTYHAVAGTAPDGSTRAGGVRAARKASEGPERYAQFLGGGLIAVSGFDSSSWTDAQGRRQYRGLAYGLRLIDVRSWRTRTIDARATSFQRGEDVVFALGGSWDTATERADRVGVVAYGREGDRRYGFYAGDLSYIVVSGPYGYLYHGEQPTSADVVDLRSGTVLNTVPREPDRPLPQMFFAQSSAE